MAAVVSEFRNYRAERLFRSITGGLPCRCRRKSSLGARLGLNAIHRPQSRCTDRGESSREHEAWNNWRAAVLLEANSDAVGGASTVFSEFRVAGEKNGFFYSTGQSKQQLNLLRLIPSRLYALRHVVQMDSLFVQWNIPGLWKRNFEPLRRRFPGLRQKGRQIIFTRLQEQPRKIS